MTPILRSLVSLSCLVLSLAACAAGGGGSGGSGEQAAPAANSHPLQPATPANPPATDPLPATAPSTVAPSILAPSRRDKRPPLVRPASDPSTLPLRALGSEIPDAPYALPNAPRMHCADPRPSACNLDYKPVCADVDTGVRCITTPCPSSERKTFSSACKACRDPKASAYVSGRCPPP